MRFFRKLLSRMVLVSLGIAIQLGWLFSILFYLSDAGHTLYTLDMEGNVETVDILGTGIDINGLAIFPAAE